MSRSNTSTGAKIGAAYVFGRSKTRSFNCANKPMSFIAMRVFFKLNGYDMAASAKEKRLTIVHVLANEI